jgi:large subunit ribosomal protein L18
MIKKVSRNEARQARHARVRAKVSGTKDIPRLNVFRSAKNISVQIIDDEKGVTLVSASSMDKDLKLSNGGNIEAAKKLVKQLLKKLQKLELNK